MLKALNKALRDYPHSELSVQFRYPGWVATVGLQDLEGFHPWHESTGPTPKEALKALNRYLRELQVEVGQE